MKTRKVYDGWHPVPAWAQNLSESEMVCNAPRPLWGHKEFQGDFIHGIFYAIVDTSKPYADDMLLSNSELDARKIEWVSLDEIKLWAKGYCAKLDIEMSEFDDDDLVESFLQNHNE